MKEDIRATAIKEQNRITSKKWQLNSQCLDMCISETYKHMDKVEDCIKRGETEKEDEEYDVFSDKKIPLLHKVKLSLSSPLLPSYSITQLLSVVKEVYCFLDKMKHVMKYYLFEPERNGYVLMYNTNCFTPLSAIEPSLHLLKRIIGLLLLDLKNGIEDILLNGLIEKVMIEADGIQLNKLLSDFDFTSKRETIKDIFSSNYNNCGGELIYFIGTVGHVFMNLVKYSNSPSDVFGLSKNLFQQFLFPSVYMNMALVESGDHFMIETQLLDIYYLLCKEINAKPTIDKKTYCLNLLKSRQVYIDKKIEAYKKCKLDAPYDFMHWCTRALEIYEEFELSSSSSSNVNKKKEFCTFLRNLLTQETLSKIDKTSLSNKITAIRDTLSLLDIVWDYAPIHFSSIYCSKSFTFFKIKKGDNQVLAKYKESLKGFCEFVGSETGCNEPLNVSTANKLWKKYQFHISSLNCAQSNVAEFSTSCSLVPIQNPKKNKKADIEEEGIVPNTKKPKQNRNSNKEISVAKYITRIQNKLNKLNTELDEIFFCVKEAKLEDFGKEFSEAVKPIIEGLINKCDELSYYISYGTYE